VKLFVRAKPGKKKEKIEFRNNVWVISINAPATDGKANERLVEFLSGELKIPASKITIQKGHTSPFKVLEINYPEEKIIAQLNLIASR
jgi:uncharacterized protein